MTTKIIRFIPLLIFLLGFVVLYKGLYLDPTNTKSALEGKPFPAFSLPSLYNDENIQEINIKGPALVNVWATWCPSCYNEHSFLNELTEQGILIYGINYKDDRNKALHWLTTMKDPYKLNIFDKEGKLAFDLGVYGAPETFIIDSKGIIIHRHVGEVNEDVWLEKLAHIYKKLI